MAVLKHIASKNTDYGESLNYLLFQHDESNKKPILDGQGRMMLREEYYLDGLNCEAMMFDKECEMLNSQYHKNQNFDEIKSHHYIISFDPKDKDDHGLTGEKAQALGLEYAKKNFPGHQAIVCTHTDGHNGSGNIHVHIVINSLRKLDVEQQDFMERTCDSRAGFKHHLTKDYLKHLQKSVMDMCQRENLYQVDLLSPSDKKITEKEYWANRRGQEKLDKLNEQILADGLKPRNTTFQTQKQFLRKSIDQACASSVSLEELKKTLQEKYQIILTEHRGRFSYLHPERNKNITGRALGTHYDRDYVIQRLEKNRNAPPQQQNAPDNTNTSVPEINFAENPMAILFIKSDLRLVVDLQNCVKAQQSQAYAQKVKISNLQQMANTILYVQEHDYNTRDSLQSSYVDIAEKLKEARKTVKATEQELKSVNEQIHYLGQYLANKAVYGQMLKSRNKKKFRQEHSSEIELYETAVKTLKEKSPDGKLPTMKNLKAEKAKLSIQKKAQYDTYHYFQDYQKELRTVCTNVDAILGKELSRSLEQEKTQGRS
ncbi:MAG: rlx protein [Clostridia bacterium]|nr:rlx protein [Clostridia bacterium]